MECSCIKNNFTKKATLHSNLTSQSAPATPTAHTQKNHFNVTMGTMRLLTLLSLVCLSAGNIHKLPQPPRPTRTLGSLFGSSKPATPPQQQQPQQQINEQKSLGNAQQLVTSGVRPLVYQVKYYDRIQNNLVDYNAIDKAGVVVDQPQQQVLGAGVQQKIVVG